MMKERLGTYQFVHITNLLLKKPYQDKSYINIDLLREAAVAISIFVLLLNCKKQKFNCKEQKCAVCRVCEIRFIIPVNRCSNELHSRVSCSDIKSVPLSYHYQPLLANTETKCLVCQQIYSLETGYELSAITKYVALSMYLMTLVMCTVQE